MSRLFACDVTTPLLATFSNLLSYIKLFYSRFKPSEQVCVQLSCSDPSGPVNSCIFVAVQYFPVFRLWSCILFITVLGCIYSFTLKYNMYSSLKDIYTSWFLSTVAECNMLRNM